MIEFTITKLQTEQRKALKVENRLLSNIRPECRLDILKVEAMI